VAEDGPRYAGVFELVDGDLAREGAVGLVEDILGCYLKAFAEVFASEKEVERWRSDDNLYSTIVSSPPSSILRSDDVIPVLESSLALLRLWMMSRMDLIVPFILKLPVHLISLCPYVLVAKL
jgi:hypothetical protein